jgi:predicted metal-dependent hydrolase
MNPTPLKTINLNGRKVEYRLVHSKVARKLRVRVGLDGVEVVQPLGKETHELESFLESNQEWIIDQLDRVERLRVIRKPPTGNGNEILFRGIVTPVQVEDVPRRKGTNKVTFEAGIITVVRGLTSQTPPARTLENWLRKQARQEIHRHLDALTEKLGKHPNRVYVMDQRTKWGNCSPLKNLSFNWRLIMAPDYVMRYLVTHEAVHLKVPDHSNRFWLTVQSLCPEMDQARQWLSVNSDRLMIDIDQFR